MSFIYRYILFVAVLTMVFEAPLLGANEPLTITRDAYGIPTIKGGTLKEVSRAIGRVQAEDRLFQIFLFVNFGTGRLAQYLGPALVDSDTFVRQLNYTDAEIEAQVNEFFTKNTLTVFKNYVRGLNDVINEFNANPALIPYEIKAFGVTNIPLFTLNDILKTTAVAGLTGLVSTFPDYQLNNFNDLLTLIGNFGFEDGFAIFNDIDPTTAQVNSLYEI